MKPWYKSRTVLLSIVGLAIALASAWQQWLSTDASVSILVSALLAALLRWLTDQPITSVVSKADALRPTINRKKNSGYYGAAAKDPS